MLQKETLCIKSWGWNLLNRMKYFSFCLNIKHFFPMFCHWEATEDIYMFPEDNLSTIYLELQIQNVSTPNSKCTVFLEGEWRLLGDPIWNLFNKHYCQYLHNKGEKRPQILHLVRCGWSSYLWKCLGPYGVHMLKYDADKTCVGFPLFTQTYLASLISVTIRCLVCQARPKWQW